MLGVYRRSDVCIYNKEKRPSRGKRTGVLGYALVLIMIRVICLLVSMDTPVLSMPLRAFTLSLVKNGRVGMVYGRENSAPGFQSSTARPSVRSSLNVNPRK